MSGRVILVGAGPGDPGLMTVRAVEAIAQADVVLYDRLIPLGALDGARSDALLIDVGKVGGGEQVPQEETHRLLLEHAAAGRVVVRVKGGDPFVFGRGGEEALLCREHDIPFEVVPGVTAGVAAPAWAGIPVTQRGMASAVAFVTGHEDPAKDSEAAGVDWKALAAFPGTLVFYMGVRSLPRIVDELLAEGRRADEPVAIVERGTLPDQRTILGTLADIVERAREAVVSPPSVTVVGPVAGLGPQLAWVGRGPLAGTAVVVTRARAQAGRVAARLQTLGARVIEAPTIRIQPLPFDLPDLAATDLLVLSSPNGVQRLFGALHEAGLDARALAGTQVAVVGPGTADAVRDAGIEPDIVPARAVGEALADALDGLDVRRAVVVRARGGRDVVLDALRARGVEDIVLVEPYETVAQPLDRRTRDRALRADWALLTSGSSARSFVASVGGPEAIRDGTLRLASIGPITSAVLRELGLEPQLEAPEHTPAGLVDALISLAGID